MTAALKKEVLINPTSYVGIHTGGLNLTIGYNVLPFRALTDTQSYVHCALPAAGES
jgi:hypothetical protein